MWEITTLLMSLVLFVLYIISKDEEVEIFCILTSIFNLIVHFVPDEYGTFAYIGAAFNDLLIILLINRLDKKSFLWEALQWISLVFICVNCFGWKLWLNYEDPDKYSELANYLYVIALSLILYKGNFNSVGVYIRDLKVRYWDYNIWHTELFSNFHTGTNKVHSSKDKEEEA